MEEKKVSYNAQNTYSTLNELTEKTKYIWLVFHGIGYLSRYFVKHFNQLNPELHYIIAPQAPSKYYLKNEYKYVGASWLTKENTAFEMQNVLNYLDQVYSSEKISSQHKLVVFGFSQGVSVALRWASYKKIHMSNLVLYAGGIPTELKQTDFGYIDFEKTKVVAIYGQNDQYLNSERLIREKERLETLFPENHELITFDGGHEIKPEIIKDII